MAEVFVEVTVKEYSIDTAILTVAATHPVGFVDARERLLDMGLRFPESGRKFWPAVMKKLDSPTFQLLYEAMRNAPLGTVDFDL